MNALKNHLKCINAEEQPILDAYWQEVFSGSDEPGLLWYPSAGEDMGDILYFHPDFPRKETLKSYPKLIIHTDAWKDTLGRLTSEDLSRRNRIEIEVLSKTELAVSDEINYRVKREYFNLEPFETARVFLLHLRFQPKNFPAFEQKLLYCFFENVNFFTEWVVKNGLHVTHFYKQREGCGFGGNNRSVSFVYAYIGLMQTQYLAVDSEVHYERKTSFFMHGDHALMRIFHRLKNPPCSLHKIENLKMEPEDFGMTLYEVIPLQDKDSIIEENFRIIGENWRK